ncbi:MAG: divalent metal cation transporter [Anaerolineae bacterium]|nr:divalent metal cation transporter [Anaerolineae bacterium]
MSAKQEVTASADSTGPFIPHKEPAGGTGSLEAAIQHDKHPIRRFLKVLGPGLITGASDDDPSGIGTFAITGASLGFATLWVAIVALPMMSAVQYICAKIGLVSGMGISGVLRRHYPRKVMYPIVFALAIANTINAGVDLGAIGAALHIVVPIPPIVTVIVAAVIILAIQIWGSYRLIANLFKWLTVALFAYIGTSILARPDWGEVLKNTFIPMLHFDKTFLATIVALLGTSISPYLFFWQASQEVEEEISVGRKKLWQRRGASDDELKYASLDVNVGMVFSQAVMYFIILATAATLFKAGKHDVQSAAEAAEALRPVAGDAAGLLLAVGLVGAGFLAVPILTGSAAYAVSEAFGWKYGLDRKPAHAKQFYAIIVVATILGVLINFLRINPMQALFWTSVINGLLAPPMLVVLMFISNNRVVMGQRVNNRLTNTIGWITTLVMFAAAVGFIIVT